MTNSPEYPGALWVPASATNYRRAGRRTFDRIVIHCTDGRGDPMAVAKMWQALGHGSSAHFVVGQDATVIQAVSIWDVAWHAHAINSRSIGIEHCARTPGELGSTDPGLPPNAEQLTASAKLVAWLCWRAGFKPTREHIVGHAEADPATTHADCPEGSGLLLDPFVSMVAAQYAAIGEAAFA